MYVIVVAVVAGVVTSVMLMVCAAVAIYCWQRQRRDKQRGPNETGNLSLKHLTMNVVIYNKFSKYV